MDTEGWAAYLLGDPLGVVKYREAETPFVNDNQIQGEARSVGNDLLRFHAFHLHYF